MSQVFILCAMRGRLEMRKAKSYLANFRQGENDIFIASMATWEEHLKGLVVLGRQCLALKEEVEHSSGRQEVLTFDGE